MASLLEIFKYPTVAGAKHYCRSLHAFKGASAQKAVPPAERRFTCYDHLAAGRYGIGQFFRELSALIQTQPPLGRPLRSVSGCESDFASSRLLANAAYVRVGSCLERSA